MWSIDVPIRKQSIALDSPAHGRLNDIQLRKARNTYIDRYSVCLHRMYISFEYECD